MLNTISQAKDTQDISSTCLSMSILLGMKPPLEPFRSNIFSQNGEDGVIQELIQQLKLINYGQCVEFGAWDGIKYSNTFNLVKNYNWRALYIEGDEEKYLRLLETSNEYTNIKPYKSWVTFESGYDSTLDRILSHQEVDPHFDLLSIDIDSFDLEVWRSLTDFSPKIVVIEINSSIPPGIRSIHSETGLGGSFTSTLDVGLEKGYRLVCHTGNMIFVREDLVPKLNIDEEFLSQPELLFDWSWVPRRMYVRKQFLKWWKS